MVLVGDPMQSMGRSSASHEGKPHCYSAWPQLFRHCHFHRAPPQVWSFQPVLKASALLRSYVIRAVPWYGCRKLCCWLRIAYAVSGVRTLPLAF